MSKKAKLVKRDKPFTPKEVENFNKEIDELSGTEARDMLKWVCQEANNKMIANLKKKNKK